MKINHKIPSLSKLFSLLVLPLLAVACDTDDSDGGEPVRDSLRLTASAEEISLDEDMPNQVALTFDWTAAAEVGSDYYLSYIFKMDLQDNNFQNPVREYEDEGPGVKTYTHRALQNLLVNKWGCTPGTTVLLQARIIGTLEGPKFVKPEVSTVTFKIKTYAPRPFLADALYLGGTAAGGLDAVKIMPMVSNPKQFVWIGELKAGTLNFPVLWSDEDKVNAISPLVAEQEITAGAMDAQLKGMAHAGFWKVEQAGRYRIAVNLTTQSVTIGLAGDHIEADRILMAGTAVEGAPELTRTLESDKIFAFRGALKAGTINFPIEFNGQTDFAVTPKSSGEQSIDDGQKMDITQNENNLANCWTIPSPGIYRIVLNTETNKLTIYSPATDPQPRAYTFKYTGNGSIGVSGSTITYTPEVLWMYGSFNNWVGADGEEKGFDKTYTLAPSLANPNLFVYSGTALAAGDMNIYVYTKNNVWAFGPSDVKDEKVNITLGKEVPVFQGQLNNRYTRYVMPAGVNYIALDVENLKIVFEKR